MQIKINDEYRGRLSIATKLCGFVWGKRGNVSAALEAIAKGTHRIVPTSGHQESHEYIELAMDFIANKSPVAIEYKSPDGKIKIFIAEYAEIVWRERKYYLEIWTPTPSTDPDLPHNRSLRFDRILSINSSPDTQWRKSLDTIAVEFHLYGGLYRAYQAKPGDFANYELDDKLLVRRHVSSTFWFAREIIAYGDGCKIIYPQSVKTLMIEKFKSALDRYQN
jgi:predicted DNA-binding transcriptional regulator YafY